MRPQSTQAARIGRLHLGRHLCKCHRSYTYDLCHRSFTSVPTMRIRNSSELGGLIRETRRQLDLDQSELAQKVGVSRQWIIEIEKGKPRAAIGLILRTLNALGICLDARTEPVKNVQRSGSKVDLDAIIKAARKSPQ
jgi:HTH-type transcriptional regulator / antitoxin HipB